MASKTRHFESSINLRDTGELTVANVWMSSQTLTRPRQPGSADEQMLIKHIVDGSIVFEQDGQQGRLEAGVLIVVDPARPFTEYVEEQVRMVVLGCPKASLRRRGYPSALSRWVAADSRSPDVRLFLDLSGLLSRYRGSASDTTTARLGSQLLDMIDVTFAAGAGIGRAREATLYRIQRYIDDQLADNALDATKIAKGVNLSVGYLNHLFRESGTSLMRYVWEQRTKRACDMLKSPSRRSLLIDEIAWRCGFSSSAHFSRMFRQSFGCTPKEMLTSASEERGLRGSKGEPAS